MQIIVSGQFITADELKQIIEMIDGLVKKSEKTCELWLSIINPRFREIDIALIAYLILCKQKAPSITVTISLPKLPVDSKERVSQLALIDRLKSYNVYSKVLCGKSIFNDSIIYDDETTQILEPYFKLHRTFSPIIPVGIYHGFDCYDIFFRKPLFYRDKDRFTGTKTNSKIIDLVEFYHVLAMEAHDRCYKLAKIDKWHKYEQGPKDDASAPQAGGLKPKKAKVYYDEILPLFKELETKSIVFNYLFALILKNTKFPAYPKKEEESDSSRKQELYKDRLLETINSLWFFTKELFVGINELAKNISEHASPGTGVVTLRAYQSHYIVDADKKKTNNKEDWFKLKTFQDSLPSSEGEHLKCLIDVNVIDRGEKGIIPTLIDKTLKTIDSIKKITSTDYLPLTEMDKYLSLVSDLEDDIVILEQKEAGISSLLSPEAATLNQQQKRSIAHIGLMSLAALVRKNKGGIIASSTKKHRTKITRDYCCRKSSLEPLLKQMSISGTAFNVLFPVFDRSHLGGLLSDINTTRRELSLDDIKSFDELIRLDPDINKNSQLRILNIPQLEKEGRATEEDLFNRISDQIDGSRINETGTAVCLNFEQAGDKLTASQLLRIIAKFEDRYPLVNFVLFNLKNELIEKLILINELYYNSTLAVPFWSENKATVLINYIKNEDNRRFYFTDVMWGVTKDDFYALNLSIDNVHFNSVCLRLDDNQKKEIQESVSSLPNLGDHPAIINQQVLLPIDLLLESGGKTLFEHNASFLLQNELRTQPKNGGSNFLIQQILDKPGYKISNTHFKIGTKLHATDFYYAKRFFQNSFFTSRFAFLLAKKISSLIDKTVCSKEELTLIGYGLYSELLISLTKKFLAGFLPEIKPEDISDNLIEDDQNLNLVRPAKEEEYKNLIIIVPIASTFSTGFKINYALKKQKISSQDSNSTYLNIVLACDWDNKELHELFGWKNSVEDDRAKRMIQVDHIDEDEPRDQYYFLDVPTQWYSPTGNNKCNLCYPSTPSGEKALFSTDKTSVTPTLIFVLPKVRDISAQKRGITLEERHVSGLEKRNFKYFLYSINTDEFLESNKKPVRKWLKELYDQGVLASETDKVILIADCHHTNIRFINLVNEITFLSSATILHFDSRVDYVDNFSLVYGEELKGADKIYFVDDSLKSGDTFNRIHFFVFNALQPVKDTRVIHGCISLINKLQPKDEKWIKSKLRNNTKNDAQLIHSFAHIHLFNSVDSTQSASLEFEQRRYENLATSSVLDHFKYHFRDQKKKVTTSNPGKKRHTPLTEMVWATHYVYELFSQIDKNERLTFEEVFEKWGSFIKQLHTKAQGRTSKDALLKILTRLPLTQYKKIRERVFFWISAELINNLERLEKKIEDKSISSTDIRILKFYIRRASSLDSSRLLHENVIDNILKIVGVGIKDDEESAPKPSSGHGPYQLGLFDSDTGNKLRYLSHVKPTSIDSIEVFCYFYVAQVVELIDRDANRSINLEHYLADKLHHYEGLNQHAKKIIRLLYFEQSRFIETTWKIVNTINFSDERHSEEKDRYKLNEHLEDLKSCIKSRPEVNNNPRLRNLQEFLQGEPLEDDRYLSYLWIKELITNDQNSEKIEVDVKTEAIMHKMMNFFCPGGDNGFQNNDCNMGAFFGVHSVYKKRQTDEAGSPKTQPFIIFDKSTNSGEIFQTLEQSSELAKLDQVTNIYDEENKKLKTIFVYKKSDEGKWGNYLATKPESIDDQEAFSFLPAKSDFLTLVYIRKPVSAKYTSKEPQAVIGFYSDPETVGNKSITTTSILAKDWLQAIRYILLLRKKLSEFIEYHHENHEFLRLRERQYQQFMINLMGHGHDMIPRFAEKYNDLKNDKKFIGDLPKKIQALRGIFTELSVDRSLDQKYLFERNFPSRKILTLSKIKNRYQNLAEAIVKSKYIEVDLEVPKDVEITIDVDPKEDATFRYNFQILDIIMLELLINAKKNRWLVLPDETNRPNKINISFSIQNYEGKQYLRVCVSNSGPGFIAGVKDRLKQGKCIKGNNKIEGIRLVNFILEKYLAKNQDSCKRVDFDDDPIDPSPMKMVSAKFYLEQL